MGRPAKPIKQLTVDQQALVVAHLKVAENAAAIFWKKAERKPIYDDLLSAAYYGLCKAALTYEEEREVFHIYARRVCMNQVIEDVQLDHLIKIPRHIQRNVKKNHPLRRFAVKAMKIRQADLQKWDKSYNQLGSGLLNLQES